MFTAEQKDAVKTYLGRPGMVFFKRCLEIKGKLNCTLSEAEHMYCSEMGPKPEASSSMIPPRQIPHPVHFREGMLVRNAMRSSKLFDYSDHDYDNNWIPLIQEIVKESSDDDQAEPEAGSK